ncbi:MAG: hypothetical protein KA267_07990 [Gemmatimonadales bacterium]|nr:hypothetical protein [Gemmatimonadales bacterium]MBP6571253.1 hypothetical protein [Gemmatimonadales bacterium]
MRVPFVVAWPGHVVGGTRSAAPVITDDLFPTLLRVAGVPRSAEATRGIRGRDLMPLLTGPPSAEALERPLYWHYPHFWGVAGPGIEPYSAIRVGQWKLIFYYSDRRSELYDLASDIGESRDLAPTEPGVARRLRGLLRAALIADGAQMPIAEGTGRPVELPR